MAESSVKILLADDSVTMHRAVALALKKFPWQLITCDNGQDALRLTLEQRPDVVIADLDMPGMTGAELCAAIRSKPALASIRLILLCSSFDQVDENHLEQIPADGRLWKPFESHVLSALIEALLKNQVRESADRTMAPSTPPAPSSLREMTAPLAKPPTNANDMLRDMTAETFQNIAPKPSSLKETVLPVTDVSHESAMENLWSPDLVFDETPSTEPAVEESIHESDEKTLPPTPPPSFAPPEPVDNPAAEAEFSIYRGAIAAAEPTNPFAIELEENLVVATPAQEEKWLEEIQSSPGVELEARAAKPVPPTAHFSDEQLRQTIREEIERAVNGWLKEKLEKTLARVLEEIDRA